METLEETVNEQIVTTAQGADDAVGVTPRHWYIAIVGNRAEKSSRDKLLALGYKSYVALQRETHIWKNGKKKEIDRIVLPALVFIHATEKERQKFLVNLPFISRFMVDRAGKKESESRAPVAIVPDLQMEAFRFMLENAESPVYLETDRALLPGAKVRVQKGRLAGIEGTVSRISEGKSRLYLALDHLGYAFVEIDRSDVRQI